MVRSKVSFFLARCITKAMISLLDVLIHSCFVRFTSVHFVPGRVVVFLSLVRLCNFRRDDGVEEKPRLVALFLWTRRLWPTSLRSFGCRKNKFAYVYAIHTPRNNRKKNIGRKNIYFNIDKNTYQYCYTIDGKSQLSYVNSFLNLILCTKSYIIFFFFFFSFQTIIKMHKFCSPSNLHFFIH